MEKILNELIDRINQDIKSAEKRKENSDKLSDAYKFNNTQIITLKTVLFDIAELKLINKK
jgi:F0F1-type ATP synthase membrane subunit b/b'